MAIIEVKVDPTSGMPLAGCMECGEPLWYENSERLGLCARCIEHEEHLAVLPVIDPT